MIKYLGFCMVACVALCSGKLWAQYTDYRIDVSQKYRLVSVANGKEVEVEDGLIHKGRRVQQYRGYSRNGAADGHGQEWLFLPAGHVRGVDGRTMVPVVRILNNGFLQYLSSGGAGAVSIPELQPAIFSSGTDGDGSMWEVIPTGEYNTVRLRSVVTNLFLQVPPNSDDGAEMQLAPASNGPNQAFKTIRFTPFTVPSAIASNACIFKAANNPAMALDVTACGRGHNTLLEIWNHGLGNTCQQFTLAWQSTGKVWEIRPVIEPAFKVKLQDNTFMNGGNIVIGNPAGEPLAGWLIFEAERKKGRYMVFNRHTGKCMEVWNGRKDAGATVGQNLFNNTDNQFWMIETAR